MFVIERNMPEILKQTQVLLNMTKAGKNYFADINEDFACYSRAYLFTTENISGYMDSLDMEDKEVLTVIGSGDHILNAVLNGAKKIDAFDISVYAIMLYYLKEAAIKTLKYEEFKDYFFDESCPNNYMIYQKLREKLRPEALRFWDFVYQNIDANEIFNSLIFRIRIDSTNPDVAIKEKSRISSYLRRDNYYKLKELINLCEVNCYCSEVKELDEIMSTYDYMFFSNIIQYQIDDKSEELKQAILRYLGKLNKHGEIKFGYIYAYLRSKLDKFLMFQDCEVEEVEPVDDFFDDKDYVLTLKKN